jgi:2-phospho-L-lactate transferase/gluconeogenesis factor (CofD/UPF0052 family)
LGLGRFGDGSQSDDELTAVVNIGDDAGCTAGGSARTIDTCMYTLGGGIDPERGWVIAMKPGTPKRNSPHTACSRIGSA